MTAPAVAQQIQTENPAARQVYFGDLHLHSSFSIDSYISMSNTEVTPDAAYLFARGEPITVFGRTLRRSWPLDFLAVTDHPENMGVGPTILDSHSLFSRSQLGQRLRAATDEKEKAAVVQDAFFASKTGIDEATSNAAWRTEIDTANRHYKPGTFTTFIGFEWGAGKLDENGRQRPIHHNVIFSGADAPEPMTLWDSSDPEALWDYLERARHHYGDVFAIVNHPGASNGLSFSWSKSDGSPIDSAFAKRRSLNEPLSEISTGGYDHEGHPAAFPNDAGLATRPRPGANPAEPGSYVREALGRGLVAIRRLGSNPFAMGVVGTSDSHTGLTATIGLTRDSNGAFVNAPSTFDATPASLTGVWAGENSREAIFSALRRREVFATSGTRIKVRFFGGWGYDRDLPAQADWVERAYAQGAPMGSSLRPRPPESKAPTFIVWADAAPDSMPLERVQIIKLVATGDNYQEQLFEVDMPSITQANSRSSLATVWTDPNFDPTIPASYYLRVLEKPSPQARSLFGTNPIFLAPATGWPETAQQRAWSSPIWYVP